VDHIDEDGSETSRPGGIFYSLLGVNSLAGAGDEIFLLTGLNPNSSQLFGHLYSKANGTFIHKIDQMPEVLLKTSAEGEREEIYKNLSSQLSIEAVNNWNMFEGILINMITGFDISLNQLKSIRKNFKGIIYFDLHTLSRGVGAGMKREFRPVPDISQWLSNIDILQCNESEIKTLVQNRSESESAAEIISYGVNVVIITKGDKGAELYYSGSGAVKSYFAEAVKINALNKVGCGDIFGAAFFYSYISTQNLFNSLLTANIAGAAAASINDLSSKTKIDLNA